MRVAMYYNNQKVLLQEQPPPQIDPGELLVRVHACGICGSDVMEWYRRDKVPLVLGHEIAAEIVSVGQGLEGFGVGERITASHHVPCFRCHYCMRGHHTVCDTLRKTNFDPGGFAEYVRLPQINVAFGVYKIPEGISDEEATFTEPVACVLRALHLAGLRQGDCLLVLGSGIAGLLQVQVGRLLGASRIIATDISEYRLQAAEKAGADVILHAQEDIALMVRRLNEGRLADIVVIANGAKSSIAQAISLVERGGTIVFFAPTQGEEEVAFAVNKIFWRNEVSLISSYAASPAQHRMALSLMDTGKLKVGWMVTHHLGLSQTQEGFELVTKSQDCLKVIIEPQK